MNGIDICWVQSDETVTECSRAANWGCGSVHLRQKTRRESKTAEWETSTCDNNGTETTHGHSWTLGLDDNLCCTVRTGIVLKVSKLVLYCMKQYDAKLAHLTNTHQFKMLLYAANPLCFSIPYSSFIKASYLSCNFHLYCSWFCEIMYSKELFIFIASCIEKVKNKLSFVDPYYPSHSRVLLRYLSTLMW